MHSTKNQIEAKTKKISKDIFENENNMFNNSLSLNNRNNVTDIYTEENKNIVNFPNNDYFKDYYYPKKKKNFVTYYSKKKFKSIIVREGKPQLSNYILHHEPFYSDLNSLNRIKKTSTYYTVKNPYKEKSKSKRNKDSEIYSSKNTFNKDETEEDYLFSYNSNNNTNTIFTDLLNNTENNIGNGNININGNRSNRTMRNIDLSRYQGNNLSFKNRTQNIDFCQQSSSNGSKGISFIIDYSKNDDLDSIYKKTPNNNNKISLNSSIYRNAKSPNFSPKYDEAFFEKKKKNKTLNRRSNSIKKKIEYRRMKFEKIREIEKKIKNYFLENGISLKNRELYHQSAIMIQSTFRAYLSRMNLYKELNIFVGIRLIFDLINRIFSKRNLFYAKFFFNNIKDLGKNNKTKLFLSRNQKYNFHIKNKSMIMKKSNILKKNYIKEQKDSLKIELSIYFNIIGKKKPSFSDNENIKINNINQNLILLNERISNEKHLEEELNNRNKNLILLNEKISNEKKILKEEIKKLKIENENLQKENKALKAKEKQFNESNSIPKNKIIQTDIHKNNENIENVSLELKEIKIKKTKIDGLNIPVLNLKKKINVNDNFPKNQNFEEKIYKKIFMKYLFIKKEAKIKETIRKIFLKYFFNIKKVEKEKKIEDKYKKDNLEKIIAFKNVLEKIHFKFKKYLYLLFLKMFYKSFYSKYKAQNELIYIPKSKIKISKLNNRSNSLKLQKEEKNNNENKEKNQILKKLITVKIIEHKTFLNKKFLKFYYQGLLHNNFINNLNNKSSNNSFELFKNKEKRLVQRKSLIKLINKIKSKNNNQLKFLFYKFYYNGIISSLKINIDNNNKKYIGNNIYIKKSNKKNNN